MTINNSVPSKYAYPRFPDKAIVVDVFPGTTFLAQDTSHEATPVDCVIRCQAPPTEGWYATSCTATTLSHMRMQQRKSPGDACLPLRKNEGTAAHTGGAARPGVMESNEFRIFLL